ncbi:MAG: hypothetical protein P1V81_16795, partial [Planctomycetota bacterium]|nr:hypothetical protein [Planctomycetota bacterium]
DYRPASANTLPSGEPGRLILVGASAFLTDPLFAGAFRADALFLNLVADLALAEYGPHGPALAELARRRPRAPGFAPPADRTRALARVAVIGGGLGALAVGAVLLRLLRRTRTGLAIGKPAARKPDGSTAPGLPSLRPLAAPAGLALVAWLAAGSAAGLSQGSSAGSLRFGRPIAPEARARTLAGVRVSRASRPGAEPSSFTFVHQAGLWRELEGVGALGDGPAIGALVEALFEAEGRVVHPGSGDLSGWDFEPETAWRIELFEPPELEDSLERPGDLLAELDSPYVTVEVGLQTSQATEAWLRVGDDPAIWQVDRSPRPALDANWRPTATQALPPLFDSALVPRSWPGRNLGLEVVAWQRFGEKSKRLVRTAVERTPEELRAGILPIAWNLIGAGDKRLLDRGPDGAGAQAFLDLVLQASASELLDPARATEYGFGTGGPPRAILIVQTPASEAVPEAMGLSLEFGPALPAELGGGRAVVNGFTGNLVRVSEQQFEALMPPGAAFGDAGWTRRWKDLR